MMAKSQIRVPFGYEPQEEKTKGTLLVYETFEDWTHQEIAAITAWAAERALVRIVLFPQHEETLRRMGIPCEIPYYQRVKELEVHLQEGEYHIPISIDSWEGKRKKYTPIDTSLRFMTDKYPAPYFVLMSDRYANLFASYSTFEEWIKKLRLVIWTRFGLPLSPKLQNYSNRWDTM
jgi:hypothetical protein